jgi:hypothetical protein
MQQYKKFSTLILTLLATQAWSWGDIGHGAVGFIAEKNLTAKARLMIDEIVGPEPLAVSAVWPDQVRSDDRYKGPFAPYHFVEIPMGFRYDNMPEDFKVEASAHTILEQVPDLLIQKNGITRTQKMIVLRYLVHVVGDVHQPLHVGNGMDMGANLCDVKWTNPETGIEKVFNLHTVWDENLIQNIANDFARQNGSNTGQKRWFGYRELGEMLEKEFGSQPEYAYARVQSPVKSWYEESQTLHSVAYLDSQPVAKPEDRKYCKYRDRRTQQVVPGNYDARQIPALDADYLQKALPVIRQQIYKAGLRLAGVLNQAADAMETDPTRRAEQERQGRLTPERQKQLLKEIALKNHDHQD